MNKLEINKIFEYYDSIFLEERVEIDSQGRMGLHYDGLSLDYYFENSVLSIDYLSIKDYFDTVANVTYYETETLFKQYSDEKIENKIAVIEAILTLIHNSSYNSEMTERVISKSEAFLKRFGLELVNNNGIFNAKNEYKLFEGSYCLVFMYNEQFYKKQLKNIYRNEDEWKKRFKYEYDNMVKLVTSPYVLKVHSYDENSDSYLMEQCDCNLFDYIDRNPLISDDRCIEIIKDIISGVKDVHNAGIIHRDLHLGNILLKNNKVILSDFGLSKDTMINHSLKSTSTPKNSHFFMDPVGLISFKLIDKLSDIYSIGKIIDYITRNNDLNNKLSYVVNKATDRDRNNRYKSCDELLIDISIAVDDISVEEKINKIEETIIKGLVTPDVAKFINDLLSEGTLSSFIVRKQLFEFWKILLAFSSLEQSSLLNEIDRTYSEATGYKRFENYDLFAKIMYNYIKHTKDIQLQKIAYRILKGCAYYRYNALDLLKLIEIDHAILKNS